MPELPRQTNSVDHGKWVSYGRPKAICADDKCPWKYVHNTLATVNRHAAKHALETGHGVYVDRTLSKIVRRVDA